MASTVRRRRWWRAAVVCGAAAAAGWAGVALAEPIKTPLTPDTKVEPAVWTRSSASPPAAVVPVAGKLPPVSALPPEPPTAGPRLPDLPGVPPVKADLPAIPTLPAPTPVPKARESAPEIPRLPEPKESAPQLPRLPEPPKVREASPEIPRLPEPPTPKAVEPTPVLPVPPPGDLAPPAPPAKSADPARPTPPTAPDLNLRPANPANSVNSEAPAVLPAPRSLTAPPPTSEPVRAAPPVVPTVPTGSGGALPAIPAPPVPPVRPPAAPVTAFPAAPTGTGRADPPTPGDTTMTPTLRHTALAAAMGALAFAPATAAALPTPAAEAQDKGARTNDQKLEDLQADVRAINSTLKRLAEAIDGRRDDKGVPSPYDRGLAAEVKDLRDTVARLEKQLNELKTSTSLSPSRPLDPLAGRGTVRVVNEYPVDISILVNGTSYRLSPNEKRDILVPMGEFQYQLLTAGAGVTRSSIREKETVTLRIR